MRTDTTDFSLLRAAVDPPAYNEGAELGLVDWTPAEWDADPRLKLIAIIASRAAFRWVDENMISGGQIDRVAGVVCWTLDETLVARALAWPVRVSVGSFRAGYLAATGDSSPTPEEALDWFLSQPPGPNPEAQALALELSRIASIPRQGAGA